MKRSKERTRSRKRSVNRSKVSSRQGASRDHAVSSAEVKKLCYGEGRLKVQDPKCIEKLKEIYRTFLIRIVKAAIGDKQGKRGALTEANVKEAMVTLFGERLQASLEDGSVVVNRGTFSKMFKETLSLLAAQSNTATSKVLQLLQKAVEVCVAKAFLAPIAAWELERKGTEKEKILKMEDLLAVNQVHLVSGSEYYSPSLVKNTG